MITRTLRRRISLQSEDAVVLGALRYLGCDPEIEETPALASTIRVEPHRRACRIFDADYLLGDS